MHGTLLEINCMHGTHLEICYMHGTLLEICYMHEASLYIWVIFKKMKTLCDIESEISNWTN
jgi:hypothetical protein